jgi:Family of unknown function (DUF6064)
MATGAASEFTAASTPPTTSCSERQAARYRRVERLHAIGLELSLLKAGKPLRDQHARVDGAPFYRQCRWRRFMEMRMNMPFTAEQFFDVFARYNMTMWPAQIALNALAVLALVLVYRARPSEGRWIAGILAALWAWMAMAYHFAFFTIINPAAWAFGAVSLLGAFWLARVGVVQGRLQFEPTHSLRGWAGAVLVVFALIVYPALGRMLGHQYPQVPTFGLPCPTTIFTIGVLLFGKAPFPRSVFVVPILWSIVGSTAAFALGVYQDLGLLVAGLVALLAMIGSSSVADVAMQRNQRA